MLTAAPRWWLFTVNNHQITAAPLQICGHPHKDTWEGSSAVAELFTVNNVAITAARAKGLREPKTRAGIPPNPASSEGCRLGLLLGFELAANEPR